MGFCFLETEKCSSGRRNNNNKIERGERRGEGGDK